MLLDLLEFMLSTFLKFNHQLILNYLDWLCENYYSKIVTVNTSELLQYCCRVLFAHSRNIVHTVDPDPAEPTIKVMDHGTAHGAYYRDQYTLQWTSYTTQFSDCTMLLLERRWDGWGLK